MGGREGRLRVRRLYNENVEVSERGGVGMLLVI